MSIQRLVVACAAAFAALMSASYAGPCSQGIEPQPINDGGPTYSSRL
jgi:hypothetical protein